MLKFYHPNKWAMLRENCLAQFMETEATRLKNHGYDFAYARHILISISYFGDWLKSNRIRPENVDESIAERFLAQFEPPTVRKDNAKGYRDIIRMAAYSVAKYAKTENPAKFAKTPIQKEILAFREYVLNDRNLARTTVVMYERYLGIFLDHFFAGAKRISMKSLTPRMIRDFIEWMPSSLDERTRKDTCSMLNNYFRFLSMNGKYVGELSTGIPTFQSKYHAPPAVMLTREDLNSLLNAVDRSTPIGKRTYASILCQVDLCMRIGDVNRIMLDDIDWRNGRIKVHNNKGREPFWLPLPTRVGQAIADYLKNGRPSLRSRQIFIPHLLRRQDIVLKPSHLYREIARLWIETGLGDKYFGTHVLRHYAAMRMKQKKCSIKVISSILGHTTLQTTAIYAKVDIPALRTIAQDWPTEEVDHES